MERMAGMWKAGETNLVGTALERMGSSPVLAAEPLVESGSDGGWLVAKLSMGSLALPTVVGKPVAGAGSGACAPFPVYSQY